MKFLLFICLLFAVTQTTWAQAVGTPYIGYVQKPAPPSSTMGNDFWVTFENNSGNSLGVTGNGATVALVLNIAAQLPTNVTISFTASGSSYTYNLAANVSRRISLDSMRSDGSTDATVDERASVYLSSTAGDYNKTMHITSTEPVAVYAFNTSSATTDGTCVYPVAAWGTNYYQLSYLPLSGRFSNEIIIANQDGTAIYVNGSTTPTTTLSAGHVYVTNGGSTDITGRYLTSSKPVAYFAGTTGFNVPVGVSYADLLYEQMMPAKTWDKQYFVPNAQQFTVSSLTANNRIRVVASQDKTVVNYAGASLPASFSTANTTGNNQILSGGTLSAGQWVELVINSKDSGAYITANNPVGVAGYLVSTANASGSGIGSTGGGDPDNAIMPGLNQMIQQVTISPFMFPLTGNLNYTVFDNVGVIHGAIIVTKKENKGSVIMTKGSDPTNLLTGTWIDDANGSGMSIYRYAFNNINDIGSSFTISSLANGGGVIVLGYGIGNAESYYYNAGSGAYSLQ